MKRLSALTLGLLLLGAQSAFAVEVLAEQPDHTAGKVFGGLGGVILGGAAGGPIGALAGAALGAWSGSGVQNVLGLSDTAYLVKTDDGTQRVVRSPNARFKAGELVSIRGNRLARPEH
jgi:outer membrane lipoprotein SlyB